MVVDALTSRAMSLPVKVITQIRMAKICSNWVDCAGSCSQLCGPNLLNQTASVTIMLMLIDGAGNGANAAGGPITSLTMTIVKMINDDGDNE